MLSGISISHGQIVVDSLIAFDNTPGSSSDIGTDGVDDFFVGNFFGFAGLGTDNINTSSFFGDTVTGGLNFDTSGEGFQEGDNPAFPSDPDVLASWFSPLGNTIAVNGYVFGTDNWVAFKDSEDHYGWLGFGLNESGSANLNTPILNAFVYDPSSTSTSNAISLPDAINAFNAANTPEPSSALLLVLSSAAMISRRRRSA